MAATEFIPDQHKTEEITAHVLWMTTGLSCEGDSVAMTAPPTRASRTSSRA